MTRPLCIAFLWHMHQPYYRDMVSGACSMPWVRLHATKDYLDMVTILEAFPSIHQTFNLVPSLLDQLQDYLPPKNHSDEFLDLSRKAAADLSSHDQRLILQRFFMANLERMIRPYPRYHDLLAKRGGHVTEEDWPKVQSRFKTQDYLDLQTWFNLSWIDPWLRSQDNELTRLIHKGHHFSEEEKQYVLKKHLELIAQVIPAYRQAAQRGQIELSCSAYYHPILPLLCELRNAHAALPHLPLPEKPFHYPQDARWQLRLALERHHSEFGQYPKGSWPPEGSVNEDVGVIAAEANLEWIATDETILWRTLKSPRSPGMLYRPHWLKRQGRELAVLFRDRELSDAIGFVYGQWDPRIAAEDFCRRLAKIHESTQSLPHPALASIVLDGENAWEFYANDGHDFLTCLYQQLSRDERFRCVTISEYLNQSGWPRNESLPTLFSGSWIDGNFTTWIGHPEKNAAWVHLSHAREAIGSLKTDTPNYETALKSLGAAEGSDWMWWFGDTHFTAQADEFDRLFRMHLINSYQLLGLEVPQALKSPIRKVPASTRCQPTGVLHPTIDGRESSYYEWLYAGRLLLRQQYGAIQRSEQYLQSLWYGFDETHQYIRLDVDRDRLLRLNDWRIEVLFASKEQERVIVVEPQTHQKDSSSITGANPVPLRLRIDATAADGKWLRGALGQILELAVASNRIPVLEKELLHVAVSVYDGKELLERHPAEGGFELNASLVDLEAQAWMV
ncbi:MAG: glycoside hydrolase [Candidatus Omnitrophica bacterium]|nr:glycoside hydrolase [Candidatus Omnitrophota bacterium]